MHWNLPDGFSFRALERYYGDDQRDDIYDSYECECGRRYCICDIGEDGDE